MGNRKPKVTELNNRELYNSHIESLHNSGSLTSTPAMMNNLQFLIFYLPTPPSPTLGAWIHTFLCLKCPFPNILVRYHLCRKAFANSCPPLTPESCLALHPAPSLSISSGSFSFLPCFLAVSDSSPLLEFRADA